MDDKQSDLHEARKRLFQRGKARGYLTFREIAREVPEAMMSPADRWLFFYSLRAMGIQLLDIDIEAEDREALDAGAPEAAPAETASDSEEDAADRAPPPP